MTKGERTRRLIVERAMPLFNTRGYFGASLNDLIRETGLEKGGIYNHFESKEAIVGVFRNLADDEPLVGGCPVLNTAVEADDAHPALRDRARAAMTEWQK